MKHRIWSSLLFLFSIVCCTGCFDIEENAVVNKDGSGKFSFIINMEQFKSMMSLFGDTDKVFKEDPKKKNQDKQFGTSIERTRRKLLNIPGVSNVKVIEDSVNYRFGIAFEYNSILTLNKAMNKLFEDDTATVTTEKKYVEWKDNTLIRYDLVDSKSLLGQTGGIGGDKKENPLFDAEKLFAKVSYSTKYTFEQPVKPDNPQSKLSPDMKTVSITCYPFAAKDSTMAPCTIANTITLP